MDGVDKEQSLVFGLGTGGCGSRSLATLLNTQFTAYCSHELMPHLPWIPDKSLVEFKIAQLKKRHRSPSCDVAFYYLPYVETIWESCSTARFVCLKRNMDECVTSLAGKMKRIKCNSYQTINQDEMRIHPALAELLPKYDDEPTMLSAIRRYYMEYYREADRLESERFRIFRTEALNSEEGVSDILRFVGIRNPKVVVGLKENSSR